MEVKNILGIFKLLIWMGDVSLLDAWHSKVIMSHEKDFETRRTGGDYCARWLGGNQCWIKNNGVVLF